MGIYQNLILPVERHCKVTFCKQHHKLFLLICIFQLCVIPRIYTEYKTSPPKDTPVHPQL